MVWKPFVAPRIATIYVVKSSKEGKFISFCTLIQTTGIFLYILEFYQGLAIDLIIIKATQPLSFVEQKIWTAHLLYLFILRVPLHCRSSRSDANLCITDPPTGRKPSLLPWRQIIIYPWPWRFFVPNSPSPWAAENLQVAKHQLTVVYTNLEIAWMKDPVQGHRIIMTIINWMPKPRQCICTCK